jgi:hypothetical protein
MTRKKDPRTNLKVMSHRTRGYMNSCQQKYAGKGSRMSHGIARTRVWTMSTRPLAGQTGTNLSSRPPTNNESGEKSSGNSPQVMSSPQPHAMNRY